MYKALTIAGSDSSGGAGIQADLKAFQANGVFGMSAITAITVQNTQGVSAIQNIDPEIVKGQIKAVFDDIKVDAVKIGMVSEKETIHAIAETLKEIENLPKVVLDPVMVSTSGYDLLSKDAKDILIKELFPSAYLITPNLLETEALTGDKVKNLDDMKKAAEKLIKYGPEVVLVKGGHLIDDAADVLYDGSEFYVFKHKKIQTKNTHGTGCTLSSAIAANLAKGQSLKDAVENAKNYITTAIEHGLDIGKGAGPVNHFYELYKLTGKYEEITGEPDNQTD